MRKTIKIIHSVGSIGFCGALIGLIVLHLSLPAPAEIQTFAALRGVMAALGRWVLLPSMVLVVVSGLLSMVVVPAYQNAGWVWAKLASGLLVFKGTLIHLEGPLKRAAQDASAALNGDRGVAGLDASFPHEWGAFWVLLAVGVANVVVGVWRPRFSGGSKVKRWEGKPASETPPRGLHPVGAEVVGQVGERPARGATAVPGNSGDQHWLYRSEPPSGGGAL